MKEPIVYKQWGSYRGGRGAAAPPIIGDFITRGGKIEVFAPQKVGLAPSILEP